MAKKNNSNRENAVVAEEKKQEVKQDIEEAAKEATAHQEIRIEEPVKVEIPRPQKGILFSRLDYQEEYMYGGETCLITPKGKVNIEDVNKLALPLRPGLMLRKID